MALKVPKGFIPGYHPGKGLTTGSISDLLFSGIKTKKTWQEFTQEDCKFTAPMAAHHVAVWDWLESLEAKKPAQPLVLILGRGGGKTSTMCGGIAFLGQRESRSFALYVSSTQRQADQHLQEVANYMTKMGMERKTGPYGHSMGWNASCLRVSNDFNVVSLGLDSAARGIKLDELRPDLIVLDDIDALDDTPETVQKKIGTITQSILPSMATHGTVCFVQNVIHPNGIMASFVRKDNEFLLGAKVFGPYPAAYDLQVEKIEDNGEIRYKVVGGEPTWEGQNLEVIEYQINRDGLRSFLRESQHDVFGDSAGALWSRATLEKCQCKDIPKIAKIMIGVDPAVTSDPTRSDKSGVIVAGLGKDKHIYVLRDFSGHYTPHQLADLVYRAWGRFKASAVVVETNQGGDFVVEALGTMDKSMAILDAKVHKSKEVRAEQASILYEDGLCHHVQHPTEGNILRDLEMQMLTWVPDGKSKSPNGIDALVLAIKGLRPAQIHGMRVIQRVTKSGR